MDRLIFIVASLVLAVIPVSVAYFVTASDEISEKTILEAKVSVINQEISYPSGIPMITSKIITIPVGAETGEHVHKYPMFAYVIEGEITVIYGREGAKVYSKDDAFIEAVNHTHNGKNTGDVPAKILTVLMGKDDNG